MDKVRLWKPRSSELPSIPSQLIELLNPYEKTPPKYVYHYGSMPGLLGVLQSKAIWASDISSLNDKNEVVHIKEVLIHAVENKFFSMGIKNNAWFQGISSQVRSIKPRFGKCVVSFCEDNDQLSLWRPYASDGMGACIGFLSSAMSKAVTKQGFELRRVIYDRKTQYDICKRYLDNLFKSSGIKTQVSSLPNNVVQDMDEFVNSIGVLFKHESFEDEREWRLISEDIPLCDRRWEHRAQVNMIVPYVVVDLSSVFAGDPEVVEVADSNRPPFKVTLGPRARKLPTAPAIQTITSSILGKGYGVSLSSSPYQG